METTDELSPPDVKDLMEPVNGVVYVGFDGCSLVGYLSIILVKLCQYFIDGCQLLVDWLQQSTNLFLVGLKGFFNQGVIVVVMFAGIQSTVEAYEFSTRLTVELQFFSDMLQAESRDLFLCWRKAC